MAAESQHQPISVGLSVLAVVLRRSGGLSLFDAGSCAINI